MRTGPTGSCGLGSKRRASAATIVEAARIKRGNLLQGGDRPLVALHGNHMRGAFPQQRARQAARPGADFENGHAGERSGRPSDAGSEVEVEEEILSERLFGDKTMPADHFAQRRQAVGRIAHDAATGTARAVLGAAPASRAASRSAAIRLVGSARPVPAMSKAVP